jgi:hypothetical protein
LEVTGFVRLGPNVVPARIELDNLPEGGMREVALTVTGPTGDEGFNLLKVSAQNEESLRLVEIRSMGSAPSAGPVIYEARMLVKARGIPVWEDAILILTTYKGRILNVPVTVHESAQIQVNPPLLVLKVPAGKEKPCARAVVSCDDSEPLEVEGIEAPEWLGVETSAGASGGLDVRVSPKRRPPPGTEGRVAMTFKRRSKGVTFRVAVFE